MGSNNMSEMLKNTKTKAKNYGGDPFYEYRTKRVLPDKFEYGMNCYLDRVAEEDGKEVAQKVFEELKKIPGGCKIHTSDSYDLPGIPTLFSVGNLKVALEAFNIAAEKCESGTKTVFAINKKSLIRMKLEGSDLTFTVFTKPSSSTTHAILFSPSDLLLDSESWFLKAVDFHKKQQYPQAIEYYNKAIKEEPLDARAWFNKGSLLINLGKYKEALKCFDKVLDIAPNMIGGKVYIEKANTFSKLKKHKKTIEYYEKYLQIDSTNADVWTNKAVALGEIKRYEEAVITLDKAIELMPLNLRLWGNKVLFLYALRKYEKVIECCDKMLEIDPNCIGALNEKGMAFKEMKRYTEALECFDKAIEIDPEMAEAWMNKSQTLGKLKRYKDALECHEKGKKLPRWKAEDKLH